MVVKLADFFRLFSRILTTDHNGIGPASRLSFGRRRPSHRLTSLQLPSPQLTQDVVSRDKAVVTKPLAKRHAAKIVKALDSSLDPPSRVQRRLGRAAIKIDVILYL